MFRTALERDRARLDIVRGASNLMRGSSHKREEEALVGLRYRIVAECRDHIDGEIRRVQEALNQAIRANNAIERNTLTRILATLINVQSTMQSAVGDERRFLELPPELQKHASTIKSAFEPARDTIRRRS